MNSQDKLQILKAEELKMFHAYNRHAQPRVKIALLQKLIDVINKIEVLEELIKK